MVNNEYKEISDLVRRENIPGAIGVYPISRDLSVRVGCYTDLVSLGDICGSMDENIIARRAEAIVNTLGEIVIDDVIQIITQYVRDPLFHINASIEGKKCWTSPVFQLPFTEFPQYPIPTSFVRGEIKIDIDNFHVEMHPFSPLSLTIKYHFINNPVGRLGGNFEIPAWNLRKHNNALESMQGG